MKKICYLYLIIILGLVSCAKDRVYVQTPESARAKFIPLPGTEKGKASRPYVVNGERYFPLPDAYGFVQTGKASWYGSPFHGRPTANGEIYDMHKKTAAHKILPIGTYVKVLNLSNNKHTIVRINDRGPFIKGRVIDLSYVAAKEIEMIGPGVADVKVVALGKEVGKVKTDNGNTPLVQIENMKIGEFTIQVGAFENKENADRIVERLSVLFEYVNISEQMNAQGGAIYKVHVSKSQTLTQAGEMEKKLEDMGFAEAFIVRI